VLALEGGLILLEGRLLLLEPALRLLTRAPLLAKLRGLVLEVVVLVVGLESL
jgi:hypothetical protein